MVVGCSSLKVDLCRKIRDEPAKSSVGSVFIDLQADRDVPLRQHKRVLDTT